MNEKVVTCLNRYCGTARDYDEYNKVLREWHDRFQSNAVGSVELPKMLQELLPYAEKLNPYSNVHSWCAFLQKNVTVNGKIFHPPVMPITLSTSIFLFTSSCHAIHPKNKTKYIQYSIEQR